MVQSSFLRLKQLGTAKAAAQSSPASSPSSEAIGPTFGVAAVVYSFSPAKILMTSNKSLLQQGVVN